MHLHIILPTAYVPYTNLSRINICWGDDVEGVMAGKTYVHETYIWVVTCLARSIHLRTFSFCIGLAWNRTWGNQHRPRRASSFHHLVLWSICERLFCCASIAPTTDPVLSVVLDSDEGDKTVSAIWYSNFRMMLRSQSLTTDTWSTILPCYSFEANLEQMVRQFYYSSF